MRYVYTLLLVLSLPFVVLRILMRSLRAPEYRNRILERFGQSPALAIERSIWIHSVSVGETQAAVPLIKVLMERYPDLPIVVTTTTPTGSARVKALFGNKLYHTYFPYDLPFAINSFLKRAKPRLLVMMETEIWPNLLDICSKEGIPTILANARLSERSAKGYARFGSFTRQTFGNIGLVAAQAPADAERFLGLGVPSGLCASPVVSSLISVFPPVCVSRPMCSVGSGVTGPYGWRPVPMRGRMSRYLRPTI